MSILKRIFKCMLLCGMDFTDDDFAISVGCWLITIMSILLIIKLMINEL